jgi:hypothetical protein
LKTWALFMQIKNISFDVWLKNHEDCHKDKWLRQLYPWNLFNLTDYSEDNVGQCQKIAFENVDYFVTLKSRVIGKNNRFNYLFEVKPDRTKSYNEWENRIWDNEFVLVATQELDFITVFSKREDPTNQMVKYFKNRNFKKLSQYRNQDVSSFLFRTTISLIAEATFGDLEDYREFAWIPNGIRQLTIPPQFQSHVPSVQPFLSHDRNIWISYAFYEDKAHRIALYNANQCKELIVVYCSPVLTEHHRCCLPNVKVVSLTRFLQLSSEKVLKEYLNHVRYLQNHLLFDRIVCPDDSEEEKLFSRIQKSTQEIAIYASHIKEAKAGLEIDPITNTDAAYFFACANLFNAALNRKSYFEGKEIPKEAYSFKQVIKLNIEKLVKKPINDIEIFVDLDLDIIYVKALGLIFSFHNIPHSQVILEYAQSASNKRINWTGLKLQPISPLVLAWARTKLTSSLNLD